MIVIKIVNVPASGARIRVADMFGAESSDIEIMTVSDGNHCIFTARKFGRVDLLQDGEVIYSFEAVQYPAAEPAKDEEITPKSNAAVAYVADCSGSDGGSCDGGSCGGGE